MKFLVLGAGAMGSAAAYDLARGDGVDLVVVADADGARAEAVAESSRSKGSAPLQGIGLDAGDPAAVARAMKGIDGVLSAVPYFYNLRLAEAAIEAGAHFCDLGGNNTVVAQTLGLDARAKARKVSLVPDCGLAPGMVSVWVKDHFERLDKTESVKIRVGGLPVKPTGALNYMRVFSVHGLINEYIEPVVAIRKGKIVTLEPLVDREELTFPAPFGKLEAFTTSGGTSTLPETYRGKIRDLDYKTIRYPHHGVVFRSMYELGFFASEPVEVDGVRIAPRKLATALLEKNLPSRGKDAVLVRVESVGKKGGKTLRIRDQLVAYENKAGHTAMMQTTAYPAAIVCRMMADGRIPRGGARPQERCVPTGEFFAELAARKIAPKRTTSSK